MIIKVIPETDAEKKKIQEVEHTNVKEFFMFGNKKDADEALIDFHDWNGSYRYIESMLSHFVSVVQREQIQKLVEGEGDKLLGTLRQLLGKGPSEVKINVDAGSQPQLIKKSGAKDGNIDGIVEVKKPSKNALRLVEPNELEEITAEEDAVIEVAAEEITAEDDIPDVPENN